MFSAMRRAMMSPAPPGANGTMMRTTFEGKVCACALPSKTIEKAARISAFIRFPLLPLDPARGDDVLPFHDFRLDEGLHLLRAGGARLAAELDEALARIGRGERLAHFGVEP